MTLKQLSQQLHLKESRTREALASMGVLRTHSEAVKLRIAINRAAGIVNSGKPTDPNCRACGAPRERNKRALCMKCHGLSKKLRDKARWLKDYGMTLEQYDHLLASQENRCAICHATSSGGTGGWHIDHCHKTDFVRGFLCYKCNMGLGFFGDSVENLLKAQAYLLKSPTCFRVSGRVKKRSSCFEA